MYYITFYCEFKNVTYESIKTNIKNHSLVTHIIQIMQLQRRGTILLYTLQILCNGIRELA